MKLKKRSIFGILLSFALMLTMMPALGLSQTAYAEVDEWDSDIDVSEDTQYRGFFGVTNDITIRIAAGKTMFVDGVIYAPGKTVTVKGPGTLIVNAWSDDSNAFTGDIKVKGADVELYGGNGRNVTPDDYGNAGAYAVFGNVFVYGGSLTARGGNGGNGESGYEGMDGGIGIRGDLAVYGGSARVSGGNGGQGTKDGDPASAVSGTLVYEAGTFYEESDNDVDFTHAYRTSNKQYIIAIGRKPVNVKLDVGAGHADMFTDANLVNLEDAVDASSATISGNVITIAGIKASTKEYELRNSLYNFMWEFDPYHNGERYLDVGYKKIDEYTSYSDYDEDIEDEEHEKFISDGMSYYLLWRKPYEKLEINNGDPKCGKNSEDSMPTVPDGMTLNTSDSGWTDVDDNKIERFEGDKIYICEAMIVLEKKGSLWRYFIDPKNFTATVKGGDSVTFSLLEGTMVKVTFKVTADHDWDEGTVTKQPTTTEDGEKLYTCKTPDCGATKTEAIPKLKPAASGTFIAKLATKGKNSLNISWNKVQGADGYDIFFAPCNKNGKQFVCKNVKSMNGNNAVSWTNSGLKKGTAYKAYVKAYVMENGQKKYINTSLQIHAYAGGYSKKFTNAKSVTVKKAKVSLKKGKTYKIKAKVKKLKKSKRLMPKSHTAKLRYMTSDAKVATVSKSGKITAKGKGKCVVTVYAHNGVSKNVKVIVK